MVFAPYLVGKDRSFEKIKIDGFVKSQISIFVHCNTLKLQALKFYFCAFCAFLRQYQYSIIGLSCCFPLQIPDIISLFDHAKSHMSAAAGLKSLPAEGGRPV